MATVTVMPTATPEATVTPTPSVKIGYVASSPTVSSVREAVQRAAQEFGWETSETQAASTDSLRGLAQDGAIVIVAEQGDLLQAAREFPSVYFIGLQQENVTDLPTNLLALGPGARQDQAGFLAGMVAGFATETQIVTVIGDPNSVQGRNYRNGFLHGVLYTCPECRVLNIDVADLNDGAEPSATVATYFIVGSDVFFAAAGKAGDQALTAAAEAGAGVIGLGEDIYLTRFSGGSALGAEHVLTSIYFDPGAAVYGALSAFHAGQSLSGAQTFTAANNAIVLAPYRDPEGVLSTLDQTDIATALARLADGSLETGIDPATGEER
jgi:basic membrane protein A